MATKRDGPVGDGTGRPLAAPARDSDEGRVLRHANLGRSRRVSHREETAGRSGRVTFLVVLCGAFAACGLSARQACGQGSAQPLTPPASRWFVTASLGATSSGPASDIEAAMVAAGFNRPAPGFGGSPIAHPFSRTGAGTTGYSWRVDVHRALGRNLLLGLMVSDAPMGVTYGHHDPNLFLNLRYSVFTVAPTVAFRISDSVHLGVGPAVYSAKVRQAPSGGGETKSQSATKIGANPDLGLKIPAHSRVFAIVSVQYRDVGRTRIGPFESSLGQNSATLPAAEVSFNHFFASAGVGVRW